MNKIYRIISILLLLLNLFGAIYGGINLILFPDGSSILLSLDLLTHTPFDDYLIPGIILLSVNGIFCAFVLYKFLRNSRNHLSLLIAQGILLAGWIVIQMLMIRTVFFLHFIFGGVGILLIVLGCIQKHSKKSSHVKLQNE